MTQGDIQRIDSGPSPVGNDEAPALINSRIDRFEKR